MRTPALTAASLAAAFLLCACPGARADVTISVDPSARVRTVDERLFGLNTAVWDSVYSDPESLQALRQVGIRFLRFPGGSTSDVYHWQTCEDNRGNLILGIDTDTFAASVAALDAQAVITANYGSGTPEEAADWVRYCNREQGYGFKYWEVGNECYGTWEEDLQPVKHDAFTYATRAADYIRQMKAEDPTIKVGVVVQATEDGDSNGHTDHPAPNPRTGAAHNGWTPVVLTTLKGLGVLPDFVIFHRYDQAPGKESDAFLLGSSRTWASDAANLRQLLTDYLGAGGASVEILVTENNQVYSDPGKQSTSLVNALFMADSVASVMQTELNGLVWWDFHNGPISTNNNSPSLYGWRQYGDYGLESPGHDRYPTYYAAKLLSKLARGGDTVVRCSSDNPLLSAYAVLRQGGSLSVLVINKSPSEAYTGDFDLKGFAPSRTARIASYGKAEDHAAQTGIGSPDLAVSFASDASAGYRPVFAPYSESVITFEAKAP